MELFLARWLPFQFFRRMGRPGAASVALLLQMTGLLWPVAAVWAMASAVRAQETARWRPLLRRDF